MDRDDTPRPTGAPETRVYRFRYSGRGGVRHGRDWGESIGSVSASADRYDPSDCQLERSFARKLERPFVV